MRPAPHGREGDSESTSRGAAPRQWIKTRDRNEALDPEVHCLAALYILGPGIVRSLPERAASVSSAVEAAGRNSEEHASPPGRVF